MPDRCRADDDPQKPSVSVVIPVHNPGRWLNHSLLSVKQQVDVNIEVILVDDRTTDGSIELARCIWEDLPWPLRIIKSTRAGVSHARNQGWQMASHELIAFLDADDIMVPGRLQAQAAMLHPDSEIGHCLSGWLRIDDKGFIQKEVRPWIEGAGFSIDQAFRHKSILPSAWMIRRKHLELCGGFDVTLTQAEDVDLLLKLALAGVEGQWLKTCLCGYRVHAGGASRKSRDQSRALTYVVERHLKTLPTLADQQKLVAEVRYGTRAWLGWNSWIAGYGNHAEQLWISSLGLSPMAPGLTWVHLVENVVRSSDRIGADTDLESLFDSTCWQNLEINWWQRRLQSKTWFISQALKRSHGARDISLNWTDLLTGAVETGLQAWAEELRRDIHLSNQSNLLGIDWHPDKISAWCVHPNAMQQLQSRVIKWCSRLLRLEPDVPNHSLLQEIRYDLAIILQMWAVATWQDSRGATMTRLEQSIAIWPTYSALTALARLHRPTSPAGSMGLQHLARSGSRAVSMLGLEEDSLESPIDLSTVESSSWERDTAAVDERCLGPQCHPCIQKMLLSWDTQKDKYDTIHWTSSDAHQSHHKKDRQVHFIENGQAWIRDPQLNPWLSTHAYAIADQNGKILRDLSSGYPVAWGNACQYDHCSYEPTPPAPCHEINDLVIVLVGLSGETYYHWLLEVLPSLSLYESVLGIDFLSTAKIWHNGGSASYVYETLEACCRIRSDQLLDAHVYPRIQASKLVVVTPPRFGSPNQDQQDWLRTRLLSDETTSVTNHDSSQILWLMRGPHGRRPVFGEAETLAMLSDLPINVLHPSKTSVKEQALQVARSKLIISAHGGSLSNLVFANRRSRVLELHNPGYHPPYFHSIISCRDLQWTSQCHESRIPAIYRDLLYESPATEPIIVEPNKASAAVRYLATT